MFSKILNFVLICIILPVNLPAQDGALLTVERIFGKGEFRPARFGPARWLDNGNGYTIVEATDSGDSQEIIQYNTRSGKRKVLVSAKDLTPKGDSTALKVDDYQWSGNKKRLLIFTNTRKVWRNNTRGDYWVLNMKNMKLQKLGGDAEPATLMFAKFSPGGGRVAYVREKNVYVESLKFGEIKQLTFDGGGHIINGTSDWVYEEELKLRDCFTWSLDGKHIAYWQFDTEGVGTFYMINNTDSIYSKPVPLEYPKVGTTNSACKVGVISAGGGSTTWFKVQGDPRNNYIPRMSWAESSKQVIIQQLNRLQNTNNVMLGNIKDGSVETILVERDEAWLDIHDDLKWLNNGRYFTWLSERDGWRHLYLVSRDGKEVKDLTPGDFDIVRIESIDDNNGWVYYIASPENGSQRYLFRSKLDGSGKSERLSPAKQPGTHSYQLSPDCLWAFHTYSTFESPPVISVVRLPEHRTVRTLESNNELRGKVNKLDKHPVEFFKVEIEEGVKLDAYSIKPPDFNPAKKYPVLFFVYGEPAGQRVIDSWTRWPRYLWHLMLAQKDYLIMCVDNRGTPGPYGREWRKSVYRQIGILASADQAAAVKKIIATRPYIDSSKVGSWGWSGGGQMTLNAMFRYPEIYTTGMAVAFVSDQRLYDSIYQERYMGLPEENVEGYKNGSPITFAKDLKGNLLIIHGTGDDNVHYQNFEYLVNELVHHNKEFSMMAYPNRAHGIRKGKNTTVHLFSLMTNYLLEKMPPN